MTNLFTIPNLLALVIAAVAIAGFWTTTRLDTQTVPTKRLIRRKFNG